MSGFLQYLLVPVLCFYTLVSNRLLDIQVNAYEKLDHNPSNAAVAIRQLFNSDLMPNSNIVEKNRLTTGSLVSRKHYSASKYLEKSIKINNFQLPNDQQYVNLWPGNKALNFSLPTLRGPLTYSSNIKTDLQPPLLVSVFNPFSGFLRCFWNCSSSVEDLVTNSPSNVQYVFLSVNPDAYNDALWMQEKFKTAIKKVLDSQKNTLPIKRIEEISGFLKNLHFVTVSLNQLGNWIPEVFKQWMCLDHNCGFSQAKFQSKVIQGKLNHPLITVRLDSRYDWLPSPEEEIKGPCNVVFITDACSITSHVKGKVALVKDGNCSYYSMVKAMQMSGAKGVIVMSSIGVKDMNCQGQECLDPLNIPATSIPYMDILTLPQNLSVEFQTTPSDNFFMGIDHDGRLAEVGWFLYPTMHFLAWQAQWFNYKIELEKNLSSAAMVIKIYNDTVMQGTAGAQSMLSLPSDLEKYSRIELDTSLSCVGHTDKDCPHWDHTVSLKVCCRSGPGSCGLEIGRWITAFRRRIGHWLTDITHLLPLLQGGSICTFTMTTASWAMPWLPSLNLRFTGQRKTGDLHPYKLLPLYNGGSFTFDKTYNSKFKPVMFDIPADVVKVVISAVITGHGSDENGCGEFCNTSHHFVINKLHTHSIYFNISGTPLGCANKVPLGVTPNEHGTWLYGRDGWCDGQDVKPWLLDITMDVNLRGNNSVVYYGYFNGTDPNPRHNPGIMDIASYIIMYRSN